MRTFAELLREYTGRTGVSDAELARAVGVQRQTIFRWKEGTVARPRSADDVLRLASKLRLTDAERDELLLATGFPPVSAVPTRLQPPLAIDAISGAVDTATDEAADHAEHPDGLYAGTATARAATTRPFRRRRFGGSRCVHRLASPPSSRGVPDRTAG